MTNKAVKSSDFRDGPGTEPLPSVDKVELKGTVKLLDFTQFMQSKYDQRIGDPSISYYESSVFQAYRNMWVFKVNQETSVVIQACPNSTAGKPNQRVKIEFNPNKCTIQETSAWPFVAGLDVLTNGLTLTGVDLAWDHQIPPETFWCDCGKKSDTIKSGRNGVRTFYYGRPGVSGYTKVYDKVAERRAAGIDIQGPLLRYEVFQACTFSDSQIGHGLLQVREIERAQYPELIYLVGDLGTLSTITPKQHAEFLGYCQAPWLWEENYRQRREQMKRSPALARWQPSPSGVKSAISDYWKGLRVLF